MKQFMALVVLLLVLPLGAQQGATGERTVEDLYLETAVEVQVIRSLATETTRESKMKALEYIAEMVENGRADPNNLEVMGLLVDLSGEGTNVEARSRGRLVNDFPEVRRFAAELLGQIGGPRSREALVQMVLKDPEPMVTAEAVYSLGLIEPDEQGRVETVISQIVRAQDATRSDNNFAYAAISALENIGRSRNGKVNPEVFSALILISQGNYIRAVRTKALRVLDEFRRY